MLKAAQPRQGSLVTLRQRPRSVAVSASVPRPAEPGPPGGQRDPQLLVSMPPGGWRSHDPVAAQQPRGRRGQRDHRVCAGQQPPLHWASGRPQLGAACSGARSPPAGSGGGAPRARPAAARARSSPQCMCTRAADPPLSTCRTAASAQPCRSTGTGRPGPDHLAMRPKPARSAGPASRDVTTSWAAPGRPRHRSARRHGLPSPDQVTGHPARRQHRPLRTPSTSAAPAACPPCWQTAQSARRLGQAAAGHLATSRTPPVPGSAWQVEGAVQGRSAQGTGSPGPRAMNCLLMPWASSPTTRHCRKGNPHNQPKARGPQPFPQPRPDP
jgi:hypothetical protein